MKDREIETIGIGQRERDKGEEGGVGEGLASSLPSLHGFSIYGVLSFFLCCFRIVHSRRHGSSDGGNSWYSLLRRSPTVVSPRRIAPPHCEPRRFFD